MIKDITIGQYLPGNSPVHRADPRTKIILTVLFMITIFLISTYLGFATFALFILISILISNIPLKYTLKGLKPVLVIVIFTAVINILTVKGTPVFEYGFIHITWQGLDKAARLSIRLSLLVISASLLTLTTTPISLTDGIEKLLGPLKRIGVPVHEIAMMMTIALRFIPTLMEETDKIMKAQAARGADFDSGSLIQRAKSFVPVLVPLFVSAFRRADELAVAMESRCYKGGVGRTRMKELNFGKVDAGLVLITFIFVAGLLFLQYI